MINVKKTVTISGGEAPYTYLWSSNNANVVFTESTGTTNSTVVVTISYPTEASIGTTTVTLSGEDSNGCGFSQTVAVSNPCTALTINQLNANAATLVFSAAASNPNCTSLQFEWTYDTAAFSKVGETTINNISTISLAIKDVATLPETSSITATVTDCNNCTKSASSAFAICRPQAHNITVSVYYNQDTLVFDSPTLIIPDPSGCSGYTFDWTTFSATFSDIAWTAVQDGSAIPSNDRIKFTVDGDTTAGIYLGNYTVNNTKGIKSKPGTITVIVHVPDTTETIAAPDLVIKLDCDVISGTTYVIPIENELVVASGATVDWSTFQLVYPPTPVSSSITLGLDAQGKRVINYLLPNPIVSDVFSWTLCDTDGNCAQATVYTLVPCAQAPTANNDTASVACGSSVLVDILQNDLGNGSLLSAGTVVFTQAPSYGNVVMSAGKAQYTANAAYSGTDTFKYTVKNSFGAVSNEATVTVTVVCAGTSVNVSLCN